MPYRFVHTADVHLDSPLRSLALRDPAVGDLISNATRQSFNNIVSLCLEQQVDALMIAGDLYDGDLKSMETAVFFTAQMHELTQAGIAVYIVRGNHDAQSRITKQLTLPDNVHVFSGHGQAVAATDREASAIEVYIHGVSFAKPEAPESLLPKFKPPIDGAVNIGLLHSSLGGAPGHDTYAPCAVKDLERQGYDYWGLGHIHQRQVHAQTDHMAIVMPGCPQGRHINEAGRKSITLVTIGDDRQIGLEEFVVAVAQFERLDINVNKAKDWRDLLNIIEHRLGTLRSSIDIPHLVTRLRLSGENAMHTRMLRDMDLLTEDVRLIASSLGNCWLEKLDLATEPRASLDQLQADSLPFEDLRALITEKSTAENNSDFYQEALSLIESLQRKLPPTLRDQFDAENLSTWTDQGSNSILAGLQLKSGED